jgi:hypothetical protein
MHAVVEAPPAALVVGAARERTRAGRGQADASAATFGG